MYVCMYVCMYVMHPISCIVYSLPCMYVRTYVCIHSCMVYYTHLVRVYVCMYVSYVCMYVCTYVCMYVSIHAWFIILTSYVCMYVCIHSCMVYYTHLGIDNLLLSLPCMHACMYVYMYVCHACNLMKFLLLTWALMAFCSLKSGCNSWSSVNPGSPNLVYTCIIYIYIYIYIYINTTRQCASLHTCIHINYPHFPNHIFGAKNLSITHRQSATSIHVCIYTYILHIHSITCDHKSCHLRQSFEHHT
jgi:hypothetical protein